MKHIFRVAVRKWSSLEWRSAFWACCIRKSSRLSTWIFLVPLWKSILNPFCNIKEFVFELGGLIREIIHYWSIKLILTATQKINQTWKKWCKNRMKGKRGWPILRNSLLNSIIMYERNCIIIHLPNIDALIISRRQHILKILMRNWSLTGFTHNENNATNVEILIQQIIIILFYWLRMNVRPVIVFFSTDLGSGLARFNTLRKSEVFALIREWM